MEKPEIQNDSDQTTRSLYEKESVYKIESICLKLNEQSKDYIDLLLGRKLELILKHYNGGLVVDLCCATGDHLFQISNAIEFGIGIDFSVPYLEEAQRRANLGISHICFVGGNARNLPLQSDTVDLIYSLSSLYSIHKVEEVICELVRVLKSGGICVLDLGASSLNTICCRAYPEIAPSFHLPLSRLRHILRSEGLEIVEHRAFQILPYWADRPRWLSFFLHPFWKRIMQKRFAGRMLDEWVSNLPLVKNFAFRHLIVASKHV